MMNTVEFDFDGGHPAQLRASPAEGLGEDILVQNARWFTRIRWAVVAVFAGFGAVVRWAPALAEHVFREGADGGFWALAAALAVLNLLFMFLLGATREPFSRAHVVTCTWVQILADLMILTILVYWVGSTDTFIAFAYLFHIVLACIFFAPRDSLLVTVLAGCLFLGCWLVEMTGMLPRWSMLSAPRVPAQSPLAVVNAVSAVFIWFVVWYLTSTISKAVRERDRKLAEANELLMVADKEKNLLMLRTTHDLKAPFAGIETNIEMLKLREWAALPVSARAVIESIEVRAATLRERIKDILLLGELRASDRQADRNETVDLGVLLAEVVEDLSAKADQRRVSVRLAAQDASVVSNRKQLTALFSNLITNAIVYSHESGSVDVIVERGPARVSVKVKDHGIGISEKALPHIFEEYFRAPEAARFNLLSTGLGLAIVKDIAQNLVIRILVTTEQGKGTTFEVLIPVKGGESHGANHDY
jgi:signal transduction histidine kinase